MGFKELEILFDSGKNMWLPGQIISGRVYVMANKAEKVRSLKLLFKGEANTRWQSNSSTNLSHHQTIAQLKAPRKVLKSNLERSTDVYAHEDYFETKYFLFGSEADDNELTDIEFGEHYYKFSCPLPGNLPTSFEGRYGSVRYTLRAILDRPWKLDKEKEVRLLVVDEFDLNQDARCCEKIQQEKSKRFCCLCCGTQPLKLFISIPVRGFVPEQKIPVRVTYDNMSRVQIKKIKVQLTKVLKFHAHTPKNETKEESTIIVQDVHVPQFSGTTDDFIIHLRIPSFNVVNLQKCRIIDLNYYVTVIAYMPFFYPNFEQKVMVFIGTTPLSNYDTEYQTNFKFVFPSENRGFECNNVAPNIAD